MKKDGHLKNLVVVGTDGQTLLIQKNMFLFSLLFVSAHALHVFFLALFSVFAFKLPTSRNLLPSGSGHESGAIIYFVKLFMYSQHQEIKRLYKKNT